MDLAKLSRLQRWILYAALDGHDSMDPDEADLYYHQILSGYFGFPVARHADGPPGSNLGAHRFDREEIGRARYDTAQASVSRAVRRLEMRGVAERRVGGETRWTGLRLTDAGLEAALKVEQQRIRALVGEALGRPRP